MKTIYLAGGCFWGVEEYFNRIAGVVNTTVGYAHSKIGNPTYAKVCTGITDAAETIWLEYDETVITLGKLLDYYFKIINPLSVNKQDPDRGTQYRTGIYYTDKEDEENIIAYVKNVQKDFKEKLAVEVMVLDNFYDAEEYHQNYLKKNPNGYCHIDISLLKE